MKVLVDRSPYDSGGLRLSRHQWEHLYGKYCWLDFAEFIYRDGKFEYFVVFDNCRIAALRVYAIKESASSFEDVKRKALELIPGDLEMLESDNDSYYSRSLINKLTFQSKRTEGTFIIEYQNNPDIVGFGIRAFC